MAKAARPRRAQRTVREAKQARSRATVDAILEAAARILVARGWDGLSTNLVAEVAGVSIGSLYEYFRDKRDLVDALHDRHLARGEARLAEIAAREPPAGTAGLAAVLVEGYVALHRDDPELHRVLASGVPVSPAARRRAAGMTDAAVRLVAARLAGHVVDPVLAARLLVDAADALSHRWIVEPGGKPIPAERMSAELTLMFRAYLEAAASPS